MVNTKNRVWRILVRNKKGGGGYNSRGRVPVNIADPRKGDKTIFTDKQLECMFSSATAEWETPQEFFNRYDQIYHFTLDAASSDLNAKCKNHYTIRDDGLHKNWGGRKRMVKSPIWARDWEVGAEGV